MFKRRNILGLMALLTIITGCSNAAYYSQAVQGHLSIMAARQPIDKVLNDEALTEKRREQLLQAQVIRRYASDALHLPDNKSYTSYVELGRSSVVFNAVITPKYSLTPVKWCFPVAGCVSYRGYYDKQDAVAFSETFASSEYDRYVGGSRAYSTLGWFDDPLTSPMLDSGELLLAQVIFHELSHQQLYIKNDTAFNEAFASAVGEAGVIQWLSAQKPELLPRYQRYLTRKSAFNALLANTAQQLRNHYRKEQPKIELQAGKDAILKDLRQDYETLKASWNGYTGFDNWFKKPVNNSRLALVSVYRDLIPDFDRWLQACNGGFKDFYQTIATFENLNKTDRLQKLQGKASCVSATQ